MSSGSPDNDVGSWVERFARLGYFVKGIVYVTIGLLAGQVALGTGGSTTGSTGALVSLSKQPSGTAMIGVVAVGLVGYVLWRLTQAFLDVEGKGRDAKGWLKRVGYLVSGLAYSSISLEAWRLLLQMGVSSDSQSQELWTARILTLPWGRWLVGAGALALFALAVNSGVVAFRRMYRDKLDLADMSEVEERIADVLAIAGLIGRGVVFVAIGFFLVQAAWQVDRQEAGSSSEVLGAAARAPYGAWLLRGLAVGLIAYGLYAIVQARYRQIDV